MKEMLIDLSDSIKFLSKNQFPSGIQKIVFGMLAVRNVVPIIILWERGVVCVPINKEYCTWDYLRALCEVKHCNDEYEFVNSYPGLFQKVFIGELENKNILFSGGPWNYTNSAHLIKLLTQKNSVSVYVHDLIPFTDEFSKKYSTYFVSFFEYIGELKVKFITSTNKNKLEILEKLKLESSVVEVIPFPLTLNLLTSRFSINKGLEFLENDFFYLSIGAIDKRKNHKSVIDLWLREKIYEKFKLFIIGPDLVGDSVYLNSLESNDKYGITYLGLVDELMYLRLLSSCQGVFYPSKNEGFGLPVLESYIFKKPCFIPDDADYAEAHASYVKLNYDKAALKEISNPNTFFSKELDEKYTKNWDDFVNRINNFFDKID